MRIKLISLFLFYFFITISVLLFLANFYLSGKVNNNEKSYIKSRESVNLEIAARNNLADIENNTEFKLISNKIENPKASSSVKVWQNEKRNIGDSRTRLFLSGPEINEPIPLQYQKDPIKLLFLGDSYSNGQFGALNELTYPRILENKLNSESPGAYKVSVLANAKSSFLRQSDWLTRERLANYDPDAIILTYTAGRLIPHFYEKKYCKQYNTCIKDGESDLYNDALANDYESSTTKYRIIMCLESERGLIGSIFKKLLYPYLTNLAEYLAVKYCTYEKIARGFDMPTDRDPSYYKDPINSPYFNDFLEYLSKSNRAIELYNQERAKVGREPVKKYMINLTWVKDHFYPAAAGGKSYSAALIKAYEAYGYIEIPNSNARKHVLSEDYTKLGNVQGGKQSDGICFYGCAIEDTQMRKNIYHYEKGVLNNPLVYRFGTLLHTALAKDLEIYLREIFIPKNDLPLVVDNFIDEYGPWFISYKKIDNNKFAYGNYDSKLSNNSYCGRIDHPHSLFSLNNSYFSEGDTLKFGYADGEIKKVILVVERSKEDGERYLSETYLLNINEAVTIKYEKDISSIYLGDNNLNCRDEGTPLAKFTMILSKE
jgi:hypothetical protein